MEEEEGSAVFSLPQVELVTEDTLQEAVEEPLDAQECEVLPDMDDSELVNGYPLGEEEVAAGSEEAAPTAAEEAMSMTEAETEAAEAEAETETEAAEAGGGGGKRKRGRPSRVLSKAPSKKKEEEDVCFICFDGGKLVLCDRRGCPKAYHPACVNRDEAFFRSKGRWNCGWHICSNCEKNAHFMCYTCTYSLCKGCIKETEFFCIRENKGLCETCMRTVMLIEKNERGNREMSQVDFDDNNSWEYLFKEYWVDLKGKLLLTSDELTQARNPWKGSGISVQKEESSDESYDANGGQGCNSDSSSGHLELSNPKKRKLKRRSKTFKESVPNETRVVGSEGAAMPNDAEWASKELLDLVAHMRNGDTSMLSQFDVQALLLEYIKQNNLRDPRRKSQIVCDSRLENLFGKPRVGHFEMLKLLESHFIIKEETQADDAQDDIVAADTSQLEADGSGDTLTKVGMDRRRKSRKKGEERAPQTNLDDYAAIDVHNINLLYLRRNLMEDLLEDSERFHDRVVGSFVRIRISGSGQKQDMYRLVQVVGTRKAQESYKTGKRSTDVLLEILNLNKTEVIAIDIISNQDFTEDECKRLRQSIKCGLIGRMTVGEVQEKALALQEVRVNDWLETEKLRLSHLRDRASETGRRKELRECVEKLQLLNTTEERSRRLQEIPDVHDDPNMDPNYESEEDEGEQNAKKQDYYPRQREAGFGRKAREPISPGKGSSAVRTWDGARKNPNVTWEPSKNMHAKGGWDKGGTGDRVVESSWSEGSDMHQSDSWGKSKNQAPVSGSDAGPWSGQTVLRPGSSSGTALETAVTPLPSGLELSVNFSETDKIWHYKDPSGKIQGPFSMVQIRKWSTTGYFPVDLKIWRTMEKQEDSILLNDALAGKFYKELSQQENSFSQPPKGVVSDSNRENKWGGGRKENTNSTWTDKNEIDRSWSSTGKDATIPVNGYNVLLKSDGRGSGSSGWAVSTPNLKVGQSTYPSPGWDSSRGNNVWSGASVHSPNPSPSLSVPKNLAPFNQEVQSGVRWNAAQNSGNTWNSNRSTVLQSNSGHSHEKQINNLGYPGLSSGDNWRFQPESSSLRGSATAASVETPKFAAGGWAAEKGYDNNSLNLPSPTPEPSSAGWTGQVSEKNWSAASSLPGQPATSAPETNPDMGGNLAQHTPLGITGTKNPASWSEHHHGHDTPARRWDTSSESGSMRKPSETTGLVDQRDFYDPPSPTPKTNVGGWSGSQGAENRSDMATTSLHEKNIGSGSVPIAGGIVAQKSSPKVNEPLKVSDEWGRQPPNTVKPSSGEWDTGATSASVLKQAEMISSDTVAPFPESGQLPHPSASNMLLKPTEGLDGSLASPNSQIAGSVPDACNYSTDQSASSIHSKDDKLTSSSGLTSPQSVKGAADLIKGSKNDPSNSLKVLSPKINLGVGPRPDDASGDVPMESALAGIGSVVSTSDIAPPTKTVDPTVSAWVSSNDSHLLKEVRERGSGSAQTLEVDGTPRLESQGWQPIPAKKVEPPNSGSRPALATQKLEPMDVIHHSDGQSSMRNLATSFSTVGQALDQPISGSLVSNPAPSENFAGPANPNDSSWSMPSAAMPLSWNASPVPAMSNNQNKKAFTQSDGQKPGNQWESGTNMQPSSSVNSVRGMSVDENQNSGLRVAPENPSILPPQGNANMGWGVPAQGNASMGWGTAAQASNITGQGTLPQGDASVGWGVGATDTCMWGTHSGDRFSGPDLGFHGGDVGRGGGGGGGRPSWNRQASFGSGGGRGGFSRPHNKAQRVCKFHESGHCKKGSDCDYLHP